MKKVIGIVGSPRKNGNTHLLVSKVLEGARESGASIECLLLRDLNIKECDGCHVCWQGKECSKQDDMNWIYPKLAESDVLVFGTPVYWYAPTALMKGFVDRFVYFNCPENRGKIQGKSAMVVIPFEETNPDTAAPLEHFFEKCFQYLEMNFLDRLIVPGVTEKGEVFNHTRFMKEAFEIGKNLTRSFSDKG
jgi:multimeric flavodoxin WrbA